MKLTFSAGLAIGLLVVAAAAVGAQRTGGPAGGPQQTGAGPAHSAGLPPAAGDRGSNAHDRAASDFGRSGGFGRSDPNAPLAIGRAMSQAHFSRLKNLVEASSGFLELIDRFPAVRGEIIAIGPSAAAIEAARQRGFQVVADETVDGLGTRYVTLRTPAGSSLKKALAELRRIDPSTDFTANHVHVQSGLVERPQSGALAPSSVVQRPAIGIIDGGVGETRVLSNLTQQGFAKGAPAPDAHATAVASLAAGAVPVRSASPGASLLIADIYGRDPKGGNSLALAKALGWMAKRNVPVVLISLVGPPNPIVADAVKKVQERGMHVVAPVGNAGPAAPVMFPASYPGVIAVTGVDSKNRALIEASRGSHLDYAAPGADIVAATLNAKLVRVRGTSFAAPLVAGRLWLARDSGDPIRVLDSEAIDLGRKGADKVFGRGLICGKCR